MATNPILAGLDDFVFQGIGYGKPPVLAIDPEQSRIGLNEFFKEYSPTTATIRDADELAQHLELIDTAIKYVNPAKKLATYGKAVLEGLSVSQEGLSYGLNGILSMQAPSASSTGLPTLYVVDEDSIDPDLFSEFMSRFQQLGHEKKPRVVVVANKTLDTALRLVGIVALVVWHPDCPCILPDLMLPLRTGWPQSALRLRRPLPCRQHALA